MRILEIEKLFESEETLNQVLDKVKEDIEKIDYWANLMRIGVVAENPSEISKGLAELGGAFSNLDTVYGIAISQKKNRHDRFKNSLMMELENKGIKYVDSKADVQASGHVAEYRRIRNILKSYSESADKNISILQNLNNNLTKRMIKNSQDN